MAHLFAGIRDVAVVEPRVVRQVEVSPQASIKDSETPSMSATTSAPNPFSSYLHSPITWGIILVVVLMYISKE